MSVDVSLSHCHCNASPLHACRDPNSTPRNFEALSAKLIDAIISGGGLQRNSNEKKKCHFRMDLGSEYGIQYIRHCTLSRRYLQHNRA